jgi:hypothetical protein
MKRVLPLLICFTIVLALNVSTTQVAAAQTNGEVVPAPEPRPSPVAIASTKLEGETYVRVVYGSPRMRGRDVFGGLVPLGEVWRTGANEATEITLDGPVTIGGQAVDAGTYALFTIPGEDEWTVILNRGLGQWGAYAYDESADVTRFTVPTGMSNAQNEAFTVRFEEAENGSSLVLLWDRTRVDIPIARQ